MYKRGLITSLIYDPRSCEPIEAGARVSRASISRGASFFNEVYNEQHAVLLILHGRGEGGGKDDAVEDYLITYQIMILSRLLHLSDSRKPGKRYIHVRAENEVYKCNLRALRDRTIYVFNQILVQLR